MPEWGGLLWGQLKTPEQGVWSVWEPSLPVCLCLPTPLPCFPLRIPKGCFPGLDRVATWPLAHPAKAQGSTTQDQKKGKHRLLSSITVAQGKLIFPVAPRKARYSVATHRGCLETPPFAFEPSGQRIEFPLQTGIRFLVWDSGYQ